MDIYFKLQWLCIKPMQFIVSHLILVMVHFCSVFISFHFIFSPFFRNLIWWKVHYSLIWMSSACNWMSMEMTTEINFVWGRHQVFFSFCRDNFKFSENHWKIMVELDVCVCMQWHVPKRVKWAIQRLSSVLCFLLSALSFMTPFQCKTKGRLFCITNVNICNA